MNVTEAITVTEEVRLKVLNFTKWSNVTDGIGLNFTEFNNQSAISTTTGLPLTPPPLGYYGDTRIMLWKTMSPIIMFVGGIGNILTISVLLRQWKAFTSTSLYLMTLAVSDTMVLLTGPLRNWVKYTWDIDFRFLSETGCKISIYITYASLQYSSWLLVAVSLERAASVILPHKVRLCCTKYTAGDIILTMLIVIYGGNILHLVTYHLDLTSTESCSAKDEFKDFFEKEYQIIDFLLSFAIPFVVLMVCNIIIIVYLERSRQKRKHMMVMKGGASGRPSGRDTSVYALMVGLCVIFFLSMTPAGIFHMYYPVRYDEVEALFMVDPYKAWDEYQFLLYQHAIVNIVSYTNAAMNFILYVFSGTKFRNELKSMFTCQNIKTKRIFDYTAKTGSDSSSKKKPSNSQQSKTTSERERVGFYSDN
ncbi:hypothetical protein ACF0H5_009805 [Mactra antiquata]